MSRIIMLTMLLMSAAAPLAAQIAVDEAVAPVPFEDLEERVMDVREALTESTFGGMLTRPSSSSGVRYTITGQLAESAVPATRLPTRIVSAFRDDDHLVSLHLGSRRGAGTQGQFNATFQFTDLAEFDSWYASEATQALHRAVESESVPGEVQVNLMVSQTGHPVAGSVATTSFGSRPITAVGYGMRGITSFGLNPITAVGYGLQTR